MNVREIIRYYPVSGTEAIFVSQNIDQPDTTAVPWLIAAVSWHIWNISEKGCSFESEQAERLAVGQIGVLRLHREFYSDDIEDVQISRIWNTGMTVTFEPTAKIKAYLGKAGQYYPSADLEVTFVGSHQIGQRTAKSSYVWDLSKHSCSFESNEVKDLEAGQTGALEIKCGFRTDVIPNVKIEYTRDNGMTVSFDPTNRITKYIRHGKNIIGAHA